MFISIYQHNLIIRLNYERQRLDLKKNQLQKQKSDLHRQFCRLKSTESVNEYVLQNSLNKIKFSQVMTFTGL